MTSYQDIAYDSCPTSIIENKELPDLNKIIPYFGRFVPPKRYQGNKKIRVQRPVYVLMSYGM